MLLVGAGQKRRGKRLKTVLRRVPGGSFQAVFIAVGTAVVGISGNLPDKFPQAVIFLHADLHPDGGGVFQQAVPAGLIFLPGVNVGIIPERHGLNALCPQGINAAEGAGRAAAMQ